MNRYLKIDTSSSYDEVFDNICNDFKLLVSAKLNVGIPEYEAIESSKKSLPDIIKKYENFKDIRYKEPYSFGGSGKINERKFSEFLTDPNIKESKNLLGGLVGSFILMCLVGIFFSFFWSIIF